MRLTKKLVSLTLVAAMAATMLTGCGSNDAGDSASKDGKFLIGGLGPLTGGAASYGISVKQGAEIAIDEINAAGGVNGMELVLEFADDEASESTVVSAYNSLMDKNINALLGTVTSGACLAITSLTKEDGGHNVSTIVNYMMCIAGVLVFHTRSCIMMM